MDVNLMKSEENFSIHLDGNSSIDAILLSDIIKGFAELTKLATLENNPDAYLKMNVTAFKLGSFQVDFSTICELKDNLVNNGLEILALATNAVTTVKGFFEIKRLLKGNEPKSIEKLGNGKIKVISSDNESITVNETSGAVVNNVHIENLVVNVTDKITEKNSSGGFSFDTSDGNIHFTNEDLQNISKPLPIIEESICKRSVIMADLMIKKPDLLGHSSWSFYYDGKTIEAKIEDEDFLKYIEKGNYSICGGAYITAKLEIVVELGSDGLPDIHSTKYSVLKVNGEIKNNFKKDMESLI